MEDPQGTLIPRHEHPRRQFVPVINVPNAYGKSSHRDQCGNRVDVVDTEAVTERIVKLAPKAESDGGQWVVVYAIFAMIFILGTITGFFISHW